MFLQNSRGNFLLQALLALTLLFAFVPFIAIKLLGRENDALMYATTHQIENATTAARIYIRENAHNLPYERTVLSGNAFSDTLEPYGLPLGFVPKTALGQDIRLIIDKGDGAISAHLELHGGKLTRIKRAELVRRVGFFASTNVDDDDVVYVGVALDNTYSDIVYRNEIDVDSGAFMVDLDMGGFSLSNAVRVDARRAEFEGVEIGLLTVNGLESGRKVRNNISNMFADKAIFQSQTGESALSLTRGALIVGGLNGKTISAYGDTGNITTNDASVYDFSMTAGHTGFNGPQNWNVRGNVVTSKINFNVERLDINSFIDAARGQDVYIGAMELEYSSASGIDTDVIFVSHITLRDQTSDALARGSSGAVVLDIRPAGTSVLPDAYVATINNGAFEILSRPADSATNTTDCKSVISALNGVYNQASLSQYIICQYVYWQRLEKRIDIKQCLLAGESGCI